ncbi:hypothetical protein OH76DRAFT_988632 [Lentinus brumalis]|uniref:HTH La-type RNA-binding domain-containing protein n=1 Tax=Lentinus brumalis TaxID=2498619 RepID=A0A371DQA4_9APHY|nr:hypothetical protein OH76DRAFT_988632 [Polyporus brumalis]
MVAPASSTAASQPLSWAERARKAQNHKSQQPSRHTVQSTSLASPAASSSMAARTVSSPSVPKASSGNGNPNSQTPPSTAHAPPSSSSKTATTASTSPTLAEGKPNGDVHHHGDSPSSGPSSVPKQTTVPPVNVWSIRKEQMAARALSQSNPTAGQSSASSHLSPPPPSSQHPSPTPVAPASTSPAAPSSNSPVLSTGALTPSTNGHLAPHPTAEHDDAFVVKPGRSPSSFHPSPPAIDDQESWPAVSQAAATPLGKKEGREEDRGHEREPSQGQGSRKSEKPKWVAVPPEELQFEGPPRTRQRSHNQERNTRQMGVSSSSSSAQASQQQSRTHSAMGRRHTPSHTGSVSHSQAQSRTGSVHSSPRHPSVRGSGRHLPDDSHSVYGANRSLRSSNANSPSTYAQPQPLPIQEFIPGYRPYISTNVAQGSRDLPAPNAIPDSAAAELNPHAPYFPPPPHFGLSPYHSPQPAGSPVNNPYPLPPMPYPGPPGMSPMPMPGYSTPPYPMYPPYGYYGQPYVYWPPPGALPAMGSPMTNGQPLAGVPPPTMMARPPPPNESDAVAGYRDVGFTLPPAAAEVQRETGQERGRRTRELSFGSITAGVNELGKSPSPELPTQGLGAVPEGAALGLDIGGGSPEQEQEVKVVGESKTFPVFSIGVAPGEPSPARVRSRTRTQSRGAVASVSAPALERTLSEEVEQGDASADDSVSRLAEAVAQVVDLTDSATVWEFGTTKEMDSAAEAASGPVVPPPSDAPVVDPSAGLAGIPTFVPQYAPPYVPTVTIPSGPVGGLPNVPSPSIYAPRQPLSAAAEADWEVRDYGYGFGRGGPGPAYPQATAPPRDDRNYREERQQQYGRPRRGSYGQGGYGYDRGGERGSYGGRRGRGLDGGYRGRGGYGSRGYSGRGGYSGQQRPQAYVPPSQPQSDVNGYYAPPMAPIATYIPQAYDPYAYPAYTQPPPPPPPVPASNAQSASPPVPAPQTQVGPLDATRYWLLGQLEYYLSAQNLAQDFWLRQQMDSRGWIPISLIASFNRVRALTTEIQLVVEVLMLSSLVEVEVKSAHVRMRQWQQYVLPTAPASTVPEDDAPPQAPAAYDDAHAQYMHTPVHTQEGGHYVSQQNHDGDEDEEEDVVFVM